MERPKAAAAANPRAKPGEIRLVRAGSAAPEGRVACYARVAPSRALWKGRETATRARRRIRRGEGKVSPVRPIDTYTLLFAILRGPTGSTLPSGGSFDDHRRRFVLITAGTLPCSTRSSVLIAAIT